MFRFTVIVCVSLIVCITAKPHKQRNKFTDGVFQDVVVSLDKDGKIPWGVEVEPPEDLHEAHFNIDPSMKIWKSMAGEVLPAAEKQKKFVKAEEDQDKVYHPEFKVHFEQDWDAIFPKEREEQGEYLAPLSAEDRAGVRVRPRYSKAEEDMDHVYHKDP